MAAPSRWSALCALAAKAKTAMARRKINLFIIKAISPANLIKNPATGKWSRNRKLEKKRVWKGVNLVKYC